MHSNRFDEIQHLKMSRSSISGGQMFFGKMHDGLPCSPTVDGRNPAPADMVFLKNANDGMNFLSTGALS